MPVGSVPSSTLSPAELVALLESTALYVSAGLELLDAADQLIGDISDDFVAEGSTVDRGIYRTVHGACSLNISRQLQWGWQRVRPYLLVAAPDSPWYRFDLGVFVLSTPAINVGETPAVYRVDGFDKLDVLNSPIGSTMTVPAGASILAAVADMINSAGESKVAIDQTAAAEVTVDARVFSIVDDWTTLSACNSLLDSVGYRALSVDRRGWYRSEPYRPPSELGAVWSYSADSESTTVLEDRTSSSDFYRAANVVVAINDSIGDDLPEEGAGIKTASNPADGPTSIAGRGGRQIVRIVRGSFSSQEAVEAAAQSALDAEKRVANLIRVGVSPNPVHDHFDVVNYRDDGIPVSGRFLVTDWSLPLDGSDMTLELRAV